MGKCCSLPRGKKALEGYPHLCSWRDQASSFAPQGLCTCWSFIQTLFSCDSCYISAQYYFPLESHAASHSSYCVLSFLPSCILSSLWLLLSVHVCLILLVLRTVSSTWVQTILLLFFIVASCYSSASGMSCWKILAEWVSWMWDLNPCSELKQSISM